MKEITLFIENTSAPYLKKILFLYMDIYLVQLILCFIGITSDVNSIMLLVFYPSFIFLFLLHHRRYKAFISEGGLTRVRLLPVRKSTFLYSELLFQFMTYLGLLCTHFLAWSTIYFLIADQLPFLSNSFLFFQLSQTTSHAYLPFTVMILIADLLKLVTLTCISTLLLISMETQKMLQTILIYSAAFVCILSFKLVILQMGLQNMDDFVNCMAMILLLPLHALQLKSYFIWKRRQPK